MIQFSFGYFIFAVLSHIYFIFLQYQAHITVSAQNCAALNDSIQCNYNFSIL